MVIGKFQNPSIASYNIDKRCRKNWKKNKKNAGKKKRKDNGNCSKKEEKQESAQPEPLKFGDPRLQQIVVRIEKAAGDPEKIKAVLENVHKYFAPDAEAEKVIALAAKLNN